MVECLKQFNRKERYWVVRNALGELGRELRLSEGFRQRLGCALGSQSIPDDAWWAIDYHVDWLFAALVKYRADRGDVARYRIDPGDETKRLFHNPELSGHGNGHNQRPIRGTQEDFDLIIAFDDTVILIEAKGVTGWTNAQLRSKRDCLAEWPSLSEAIFNDDGPRLAPLKVFVALMSPKKSDRLSVHNWPAFLELGDDGQPFFLPIDFSDAPEKFMVPERCEPTGASVADWQSWHFKEVSRPECPDEERRCTVPVAP